MSPTRISFVSMKSALCRLARLTVVPASFTGSRFATGVSVPSLPIWISMLTSLVSPCSAANLNAITQRGDFEVVPSFFLCAKSLILITMPSVSYGKSCRFVAQLLQ